MATRAESRSSVAPEALGLRTGEDVRFRRSGRSRWNGGRLECIERDGSIGIRDDKGAARSLRAAEVEVRGLGPKGARRWESVAARLARGDQLELF